MRSEYFQKGLSPLGGLFVAAVGAAVLMIVLKLMPHYMDYSSIKTVHEKMALEPNILTMAAAKRNGRIQLLLTTHQVRSYDSNNSYIGESENGQLVFGFQYEIKESMVANVSAVLDFSHEVEIKEAP